MTIRRISPDTLKRLPGGTQIAEVAGFVFISGQVSQNERGEIVGEGDIEAQAVQVFANLRAAMQAVGGDLSNLVKTTTYITSAE